MFSFITLEHTIPHGDYVEYGTVSTTTIWPLMMALVQLPTQTYLGQWMSSYLLGGRFVCSFVCPSVRLFVRSFRSINRSIVRCLLLWDWEYQLLALGSIEDSAISSKIRKLTMLHNIVAHAQTPRNCAQMSIPTSENCSPCWSQIIAVACYRIWYEVLAKTMLTGRIQMEIT